MELTLAESVLLFALDDATGSTGDIAIDPSLAGAPLVDLGALNGFQRGSKRSIPRAGDQLIATR